MENIVPKPAASLILLRGSKVNPEVLLGRRKASLRFIPGYYVYPGGRIDEVDFDESRQLDVDKIQAIKGVDSNLSSKESAAHILGVIREVWEETGLLLGKECTSALPGQSALIKAFNKKSLQPLMNECHCIAQAITPPGGPVRFNTYFFIADGTNVVEDSDPSGELEDVGWHNITNALENLEIADVTQAVLSEALNYWESANYGEKLAHRVPLLTYPIYNLEIQR